MKVLITGGAGYIGYSLVRKLEEQIQCSQIKILDNMSNASSHVFFTGKILSKTQFIKGDILDLPLLETLVEDADCIVHLAAQVTYPFNNNDNYKYEQVNQYGTLNLYQALKKTEGKKVIYLSSATAYGYQENCTAETNPEPENAYGKSKFLAEQYLQLVAQNTELYILRCANIFGYNPAMRTDLVINGMTTDALLYKKLIIYGNGNQKRPFIHLDSIVEKIIRSIESIEKTGIYNCVEANKSINQIKDVLLKLIPNLEFTYVNTSTDFKSLTLKTDAEESQFEQKLESYIEEMKQKFTVILN